MVLVKIFRKCYNICKISSTEILLYADETEHMVIMIISVFGVFLRWKNRKLHSLKTLKLTVTAVACQLHKSNFYRHHPMEVHVQMSSRVRSKPASSPVHSHKSLMYSTSENRGANWPVNSQRVSGHDLSAFCMLYPDNSPFPKINWVFPFVRMHLNLTISYYPLCVRKASG